MTTPFSKLVTSRYIRSDDELEVLAINLADKCIINVAINGVVDTTFDIPLSTNATVRQNLCGGMSYNEDSGDFGIEPVVLVGEVNNTKLEVVATQIGKIMVSTVAAPKSIILSIGSKWFGRGDQSQPDDFDKLMFVLESVKKVIT